MSRLLVEELKDTLSQKKTFVLEKRTIVRAFCPYLFVNNSPNGTFNFKVINEENVTVWSKSFTCTDIKESLSTSSNNIRVYYPLIANPYLILGKGTYEFKLEASGYLYNRNSFLGWIKDHESDPGELSYEPINDAERPLSMRIKVLRDGIE